MPTPRGTSKAHGPCSNPSCNNNLHRNIWCTHPDCKVKETHQVYHTKCCTTAEKIERDRRRTSGGLDTRLPLRKRDLAQLDFTPVHALGRRELLALLHCVDAAPLDTDTPQNGLVLALTKAVKAKCKATLQREGVTEKSMLISKAELALGRTLGGYTSTKHEMLPTCGDTHVK